ncbi:MULTISPECIES: PspC domain-containing protein [unclassified Actinotalea]|uniref:PspC domain-containing protein n=1 Tax=unclassified Actinotalea TaxID=2638618 RepID=UPI0021032003|nr:MULTISPECIES: PspC domain-containing protein [unclassified Actinotalea]
MNIHESMYRAGLSRPSEGRVLGGVCAGIARRVGLDPWGTRLLVFVLMVVLPGSPLILYPIAWALMPADRPGPVVHVAPPPPGSVQD